MNETIRLELVKIAADLTKTLLTEKGLGRIELLKRAKQETPDEIEALQVLNYVHSHLLRLFKTAGK